MNKIKNYKYLECSQFFGQQFSVFKVKVMQQDIREDAARGPAENGPNGSSSEAGPLAAYLFCSSHWLHRSRSLFYLSLIKVIRSEISQAAMGPDLVIE